MRAWDGVDVFVDVVRFGSFSAAARHRALSTAFVSRAVSGLEQRLNTQLLHRTTRRLRLTEAGRIYYEHACALLDGFDAAELALASFQQELRGEIRISLATTYGERYVAPLINVFLRQHPQLHGHMDFSNRRVDLVDEGYDLAVRTGPVDDANLVARQLGRRTLYVVGSPAYLAEQPAPDDLSDLASHRCLIGSSPNWLFADGDRLKPHPVHGSYRANAGHVLLDAALQGMGLAQLPDFYVEDHLHAGRLQAVLEHRRQRDGAVWLVYPRSRHQSPKVRQLTEFLLEHMPASPWR